jgi:predicted TIM-barrel fold metal-dependent hydrolase
MMIVDFHTHILPPQLQENRDRYLGREVCFDLLYKDPKARIATAEELIANMDRDGINVSVVLNIGWSSHELCHETNDYILEAAARYPTRLVGFCAIQPLAGEKAIVELERCVKGGAKGIGELRCDTQGFDFTDRDIMGPIAQTAMKHRLIILTHASEPVGHSYSGKGNITPGLLYSFITNFPDLTLVCAHWGGGLPFYALMPEVARALSNVYFDTAASPWLYQDEIFRHVTHIIGPEKVLYGSDFPLMKQSKLVKSIQASDLSGEAKSMILGGNARRLLSLS